MLFIKEIQEALAQRAQCVFVMRQLDVPDLVTHRFRQGRIDRIGHDGVAYREDRQADFVAVLSAGVVDVRTGHDHLSVLRVAENHQCPLCEQRIARALTTGNNLMNMMAIVRKNGSSGGVCSQ
jgi:hypothetical protein